MTNTTYCIKDDKDPSITKNVHCNHLVRYYPKEQTLPPMVAEFAAVDQRQNVFFERFMEEQIPKLKNPKNSL